MLGGFKVGQTQVSHGSTLLSHPTFFNYSSTRPTNKIGSQKKASGFKYLVMDPSSPLERSAQNSSVNPPGASTLPHRPSPGRQSQRTDSDSPNRGDGPIPDDNHGADLPMNMSASVMLTGLPRDAHQALADVEAIDAGKGTSSGTLVSFCPNYPPCHLHIFLLHKNQISGLLRLSTSQLMLLQSLCASSRCHLPRYLRIGCSRSARHRSSKLWSNSFERSWTAKTRIRSFAT